MNHHPRLENLKPFEKGMSGNPNGRPRKFVSTLIDKGYKRREVNDTILAILALTEEEMDEIAEHPEATILELTIIAAMRKGIERGNLHALESLLSRAYGSPKQELTASVESRPIWEGLRLEVV